ncbi:DUF255 domain-containing protein [Cryomorpha ignava]|uniref:DUF255 domain-containing protein n=1 Tax=Cryomorpha ignava TaxID=101383 RepID=A0A7K3WQD6_9FLAO|nr:thioredoxin fold domain-containing protein [Cryomorpha ignava]NEN23092.1 DUF255 domain-containing protein [Cryomorpha ignava]
MKKLLFLLLFFPSLIYAQNKTGGINWISWDEVEAKMEKEPRKVMVDVYTDWCGPCKMMNNTTFSDPQVVQYINENYYAIKFNAEGSGEVTFRGTTYKNETYDANKAGRNGTHDLTRAIAPVNGRIAYPTIVYMDEDFGILSPVQGFYKPEQIMPILTFFAENVYKDKTWEEYTKAP